MAIVVEHEKRRREILEKALDVFVEEGFENATYQKIADRCGITRTTLYIYFRNKREVFNFSIKQLLGRVEDKILRVRKNTALSHPEKLKETVFLILQTLEENGKLLQVILDYLLYLSRSTASSEIIDTRLRRRTIKLRHILATMVIDGMKAGELKKIDVRTVDDIFYGLIETAIFHLAVLKRPSVETVKNTVALMVELLADAACPAVPGKE
ncbi:MAG: TetR/AcrR family transcriptional regulator [Treponema sp.]|jgi:AcrR family transcriptional regulator|nr:TetR/AcrR family transcriptional regulator [Treponema sp.]